MKLPLLAITAVLIGAPALLADLVIVQNVKTSAQGMNVDMEMTMHFKGNKARIDVGDQVSTIMDTDSDEVINLMHQQKMVMTMNNTQLSAMQKQMLDAMGKDVDLQTEPEIKPTGNKETINGFETEEYIVTQGGVDVNYWLAKDYPNKEKILEQMARLQDSKFVKMSPNAKLDPRKLPGIPIRINATGTEMTLVSIDEKEVDESLFVIPDDYSKMEMPGMGDLLKKLPKSE